MKRLVFAAALLLVPVAGQAQQTGTDQERRAAFEARRDSLEAEVVHKFVRRLGRELKLSDAQQSQMERVLRQSGLQRRELSRASMQLRGRIYRATRSDATPEAEFVRLLEEHEALRVREHDLWRHDQEQLARILDTRQRAQFILSWAHFQDDMRDILSRRMREQSNSRDRSNDGPRDERDHDHDPDRRDRER